MATVPDSHDFADGIALSSEMNSYVRDPVRFLLNKPRALLQQTTLQSIPNITVTAVTFNTEVVDLPSPGGHDNVTNNSRYTAVYAGYYLVAGGGSFVANATGTRNLGYQVNGAVVAGSQVAFSPGASSFQFPGRSMLIYLDVGDYLEMFLYQTSGGALNTDVTNTLFYPSLTILWQSNA